MREEHNIDRLFQESFKDFDVDAPKNSWHNIEKRLSKKSRKKVIPLWQKLSGVAAIIAIFILVGSQWIINPSKTNKIIVDIPQDSNKSLNKTNTLSPKNINNSPTLVDESKNQKEESEISITEKFAAKSNPKIKSQKTVHKNKITSKDNINQFDDIIAYKQKSSDDVFNMTSNFGSKKLVPKPNILIKALSLKDVNSKSIKPQKKSLVEVAKEINNIKIEKKASPDKSWFIKPQVSPVFYGNLGSGNAIDPALAQNNGQGEVNMSYGINIAYKLNDKIKLRTGLNNVNLNYTTNDVLLIQSIGLSSLSNVNTDPNFKASIITDEQLNTISTGSAIGRFPSNRSEIRQKLGYLEIPMEIEYKLIDNKIDINLIGGASTFLLNNNNLDIRNSKGTITLGEANNLNNLSFSTNFAIGLDYDISKRFMLNLEPTFKYQFNTFQNGTTDFQPYFLGIYSGIVFKF